MMTPILLTLAVANLLCVAAWAIYAADEIAGRFGALPPLLRIAAVLLVLWALTVGGVLIVVFLIGAEVVDRAQRARKLARAHGKAW